MSLDSLEKKLFDATRAENAIRELLYAIGENPDRDGLLDTPKRVARMYEEVTSGIRCEPAEELNKCFEVNHDEMVMVRDISLYSLCEHLSLIHI